MRIFKILALCIAPVYLLSIPADMYVGAQYSYYSTNNMWTNGGSNVPAHNKFTRHDLKGYGGFDLSRKSCVWVQGGYDAIRQQINPDRQGLEDVNVGFYRVANQQCERNYGWGLQLFIPGGEPRSGLRYGAWAGEFYLSYQNRIKSANCCIDLGYRTYSKIVSDAVRAAFRVDWPFTRRIQMTAQGDFYYALFNGRRRVYDNKMAFNPNTRLLQAKVLAVYQLNRVIYLNLGCFKYLWGQNVGSGGGVFGGAFWNY